MTNDDHLPPHLTASILYDGTTEQQEWIARMRGDGVHVTVWGAPDGYRLPAPVDDDAQGD